MSDRRRVPYAVAGAALRQAHARAWAAGISERQWRTLSAVVDLTAAYSRLGDRLYLAAIAVHVYDTDKPEPWQIKKIGRDLQVLARAEVITRGPPKAGRPSAADGRARYWVALPAPEKGPPLDPLGDVKRGHRRAEKGPPGRGKGAASGGPTEETSEETVCVAPDGAPRHDAHTQFPPSAIEAKKAGRWNIRQMIQATEDRLGTWHDTHDPDGCALLAELQYRLIKVGALDDLGDFRWDLTDRARFDARDLCEEIDAWLDDGRPVPGFLASAVYRTLDAVAEDDHPTDGREPG